MKLAEKVKELKLKAFERALSNKRGHLGGSFSCAEFLTTLYYGSSFKYFSKNPNCEERDYFIMSKGHASNVFYEILHDLGFITLEQLSNVSGHCDLGTPGIEATTGSLGHGLGIAAGLALGLKMDNKSNKVVCLIGDGEMQEGSIWEAIMFISHHKLNNLLLVIDFNCLGSEDFTYNTCEHKNIIPKLLCFGISAFERDGHNIPELQKFLNKYLKDTDLPTALLLKTIKGKGLTTLENTPKSHHHLPSEQDVESSKESILR
ncbi:MAG: transketolase [Novosphingobium sp.]|nr:transketolase [Novosphingobium sp.]